MKIIEVENSKLAKLLGYSITLYPFILYANTPDSRLRKHEFTHIAQIESLGVVKFYFLYIKYYLANRLQGMTHDEAYMAIPFEKEAYEKESL